MVGESRAREVTEGRGSGALTVEGAVGVAATGEGEESTTCDTAPKTGVEGVAGGEINTFGEMGKGQVITAGDEEDR